MEIKYSEEIPNRTKEEFKIHYHLPNGSHEIDALVRNRCEAEILALMQEVGRVLDVPLEVASLPPADGGWEEHILLIGQYSQQISFVRDIALSIFTFGGGAISAALFIRHRLRHARQQTSLNDLAIERAKLEIRKLKQEGSVAARGGSGDLELEARLPSEDIARALLGRKKIQLRRSNLYRNLDSYTRVEAVGFASSHRAGASERIIERQRFAQFIVEPAALEPMLYKRVEIEVVSPVLRAGNHNWRGIFEKRSISFELDDGEFRRRVLDQEVSFQNGSKLICDLEVQLRDDEVGEPEVTKRVVRKVHSVRQVLKFNAGVQGTLDLADPNTLG